MFKRSIKNSGIVGFIVSMCLIVSLCLFCGPVLAFAYENGTDFKNNSNTHHLNAENMQNLPYKLVLKYGIRRPCDNARYWGGRSAGSKLWDKYVTSLRWSNDKDLKLSYDYEHDFSNFDACEVSFTVKIRDCGRDVATLKNSCYHTQSSASKNLIEFNEDNVTEGMDYYKLAMNDWQNFQTGRYLVYVSDIEITE